MTWQTFDIKRRDDQHGPHALTTDGQRFSAEAILLQRSDTGNTRAVLGFLVGTEYKPAEEIPNVSRVGYGMRFEILTEAVAPA
ncbi:hypothetical protein QM583_10270 [Gordonia alkanivorans]|uniref:hypothetical protein n=1 Tax=Gordonia alkanivorans TaxID=84096 RepID=UPI0024B71FF6|nr:hypothetical protein [Gordonia alkanivorans]MDJ0027477.1 hypothetical protein [Gordonia alkanivorans]